MKGNQPQSVTCWRWSGDGEASFCTVVLWKDVVKVNCALDELDHCAGVNEASAEMAPLTRTNNKKKEPNGIPNIWTVINDLAFTGQHVHKLLVLFPTGLL